MSTRLFGRRVVLQLGTESSTGKQYTDLRVVFDVQMKNDSTPTAAKIEAYNLNPNSVALAQADDAIARLLVGYRSQGGTDRLIFEGNPITNGVKLELRGQDRVLVLDCQDGGREYSSSRISESFSAPMKSSQIFQLCADRFVLTLGNVDAVVGDVSFPAGFALKGKVKDVLDRVAVMSGARWSIRDRTLQFWADGGSTGEEAVVFSASTGNLVGSPTITDDGVELTGLLAPTLRPGKPFRVESDQVNGDYVATDVQFKGDSGWATEFYVNLKGTPLAA